MDITKLPGYYSYEVDASGRAVIHMALTEWRRLLVIVRMGLELAERVDETFKPPYSGEMVELARALREKAREL